jgi:pimeloyl-ACP methyl ester carboxylesterase
MTTLSATLPPLHHVCNGQGEDVVMIHGLGANLAFWYMGIAKEVATRFRVITYDLRGHGRSRMHESGYTLHSMGDDLDALLDHLGVGRAHVVGHSFGARVALAYTIRRPERVASLTVADTQVSCLQPPVRLRDWPHWGMWKKQLIAQGYDTLPADDEIINYRLLASFNRVSPQRPNGGLSGARHRGPSLRDRDMGRKGALNWERLLRSTSAARDFENDSEITIPALRQIAAPTLVIYGEYSHCLPTCWALKDLIPDSHVMLVRGAGHFHPAVKPRYFVRVLLSFLQRSARLQPRPQHSAGPPAEHRGRARLRRRLLRQRLQ